MADDVSGETDWAARRRDVARKNRRGHVDHIKAGHGDFADGGAMENDARVYTDPARLEAELEHVFLSQPILAGLSRDLPEPGSLIVFQEFGTSIIIVRNKSGKIGAFLNMCTHRGATLAEAPCRKNLITCPFHGWSFDLDGAVVAIPEIEAFGNIDRATRGLVRVPCAEWGGMVFIKPRPGEEEIDVEAHLGDFAPELLQLELHNAEPVKSGMLEAECNWKYALDTYSEGYHFPALHPETVSILTRTETLYEAFGRHHRVGFAPRALGDLVDLPEDAWPDDHEFGAVHYLFPNTVIFYGTVSDTPPFVQIFRHFPDGIGHMHTNFAVYSPGGVSSEAEREMVSTMGYDATAHVVDSEDYWIARSGWQRLKSAPKGFKVLYGANEIALQDQHRNIAEAARMPLDIYDE